MLGNQNEQQQRVKDLEIAVLFGLRKDSYAALSPAAVTTLSLGHQNILFWALGIPGAITYSWCLLEAFCRKWCITSLNT